MAGKQWQEGRVERKSVIMHESEPISCHGAGETEAGRAGEKERMFLLQTRGQQLSQQRGPRNDSGEGKTRDV